MRHRGNIPRDTFFQVQSAVSLLSDDKCNISMAPALPHRIPLYSYFATNLVASFASEEVGPGWLLEQTGCRLGVAGWMMGQTYLLRMAVGSRLESSAQKRQEPLYSYFATKLVASRANEVVGPGWLLQQTGCHPGVAGWMMGQTYLLRMAVGSRLESSALKGQQPLISYRRRSFDYYDQNPESFSDYFSFSP
jgi:hypothetical protein